MPPAAPALENTSTGTAAGRLPTVPEARPPIPSVRFPPPAVDELLFVQLAVAFARPAAALQSTVAGVATGVCATVPAIVPPVPLLTMEMPPAASRSGVPCWRPAVADASLEPWDSVLAA